MKSDFEHTIDWISLTNYLSNEINKDERKKVEQWINKDKANLEYFEKLKKIWNNTTDLEKFELLNIEDSLLKVKRKANISKKENKRIVQGLPGILLRIAAVLIIGVGVFIGFKQTGIFNSSKLIVANTNNVTKSDLLLSDGSMVYLNSNTILEYPKEFYGSKREIFLKGQAFFDIKRDETLPFIIHAGNAKIEVLGTSFDVNTSSDNENIEVVVESGEVALSNGFEKQKSKYERVVLITGERGFYSKLSGKIEKKINTDINYLYWKTKEIVFEDTNLDAVVRELGKIYKVGVNIEKEELKSLSLTATFNNKSFDEIVEIIEVTLNVTIDKQGNVYEVKERK